MVLAFIICLGVIRLRPIKHRREISFSAKPFSVLLKNSTFFFWSSYSMVIAKALCLFSIWRDNLVNLVILVMWVLGKGGNSRYANHMSLDFQITSKPLHIWVYLPLAKQVLLLLKGKSTETYLMGRQLKLVVCQNTHKTKIWWYKCKWIKSTCMKIPLKYTKLYEICIGFFLAWHGRKLI